MKAYKEPQRLQEQFKHGSNMELLQDSYIIEPWGKLYLIQYWVGLHQRSVVQSQSSANGQQHRGLVDKESLQAHGEWTVAK